MNPKRQRFCEEYALDLNGTQAAIRAGYAANSAHVTASRLLMNAKVRERVDQLIVEHRERIEVSVDSLSKLFIDDRKLAHDNKQAGAAVSATEKLAKLHGLMSERLKVDVNVTTGQMTDAEINAELAEVELERIREGGREWIVERIARYERFLAEFDSGAFDEHAPQRVAGAPASPPLVALPASEFQTVLPEE